MSVPDHSGYAKDLREEGGGRENLLIAIGGGSASGKSTLASMIEDDAKDAVVLSLDDYYKDETDISRDHPASIEWGELKVDLLRLLNGRVTTVPTFDFEEDSRGPQDSVKPANIVIVEGLWACGLGAYAGITPDEAAYIYAPDEIRLARRVLRDVEERGCEAHEVVERWQEEVRPHHNSHVEPTAQDADINVDGQSMDRMEEYARWVLNRHKEYDGS